jgi:hypothetical protein
MGAVADREGSLNAGRIARVRAIRALAMLMAALAATPRVVRWLASRLKDPVGVYRALRSRTLLWPWLSRSSKLLLGTLAYNVFLIVAIQPVLRKLFPPLKPWEHVAGIFGGSTRTTYEHLVPIVGATIWIVGNGLLFAFLNRDLRKAHAPFAEGGTITPLDSRARLVR